MKVKLLKRLENFVVKGEIACFSMLCCFRCLQCYIASYVCNVILLQMFAMLYCFRFANVMLFQMFAMLYCFICLQWYIVSDACSLMLFKIIAMLYCFRCLHCHVVSDVYNVILFQMFTMLYCFRCLYHEW